MHLVELHLNGVKLDVQILTRKLNLCFKGFTWKFLKEMLVQKLGMKEVSVPLNMSRPVLK